MAADCYPHLAYIGLGGNLDGPLGSAQDYVETAIERLARLDEISMLRRSRLYRTAAWGKTDQADFINAVAELRCSVEAIVLFQAIQRIEEDLGRVRGERWGPRLIDLDLLAFNQQVFESDSLTLPHPRMHQRAFVLAPLLELQPNFEIPGHGRAADCLAALGNSQPVEAL